MARIIPMAAMSIEAAVMLGGILAFFSTMVGAYGYRAYSAARRIPPDAYRQMENTLADMVRQQNEMRAQQATDHLAMRQMAMQITRLEIGVLKLSEQVRQLGGVPVYVPETPPETPPVIDDRTLAAAIAALFNLDELSALGDDLDIPDGTLAGETVTRRARELVEYMRRRNRLAELIATARRLRPEGGF